MTCKAKVAKIYFILWMTILKSKELAHTVNKTRSYVHAGVQKYMQHTINDKKFNKSIRNKFKTFQAFMMELFCEYS